MNKELCKLFPRPKENTAHNFSCCDTHGGQAFRSWTMLMKHKGVFIGFHNHEWRILISSDPNAKWVRGCQDSCAHADPFPQSPDGAYFIDFKTLPDEAKELCKKWIAEAIEIAQIKIKEQENRKKRVEEERRKQEEEKLKKEVLNPWLKAVEEEK